MEFETDWFTVKDEDIFLRKVRKYPGFAILHSNRGFKLLSPSKELLGNKEIENQMTGKPSITKINSGQNSKIENNEEQLLLF
ncbi:hypothetical protein A3715_17375 [Oleiphilus sp. HI0009]|nr:hypothetical protein A3715_17375 [Oleiphilus sp. HI0009]